MAQTDRTGTECQQPQQRTHSSCVRLVELHLNGEDTDKQTCEESAEVVLPAAETPEHCQAGPHRSAPRESARYLNVDQACGLLQIGKSTFYRLLANPDSRLCDVAVRIPVMGHLRFPERKLRRWLEGRMPRRRSGS